MTQWYPQTTVEGLMLLVLALIRVVGELDPEATRPDFLLWIQSSLEEVCREGLYDDRARSVAEDAVQRLWMYSDSDST